MIRALVATALAAAAFGVATATAEPPPQHYEPTRASLDRHPLPAWWTAAKFGIFIHWGVYAVPAFAPKALPVLGYAEQYWRWQQIVGSPTWLHHLSTYGPQVVYDDFIPQFRAERYDPDAWIKLFERAGAKYFVLTAKHLDGFRLWPSPISDRNSVAMGPRRDLVGDLFAAAHRARDRVRPGVYYQVPEQFNPAPRPLTAFMGSGTFAIGPLINAQIPARNAYTQQPVAYTGYKPAADYATGVLMPDVADLVRRYRPNVLWCDWGGDGAYLQSNRWIADYYNATSATNPDGVVVDDRCGNNTTHRDFRTVEYENNFTGSSGGPAEVTRGMGTSFGYNAQESDADLATPDDLIDGLVAAVSAGDNYLLDIGPKADGTIPEDMQRRLVAIGDWLRVNGRAIYASRAWTSASDPKDANVHYTEGADGAVYAIRHGWPGAELRLGAAIALPAGTQIALLGSDGTPLAHRNDGGDLVITMPARAATTSEYSFTLRIGKPAPPRRRRPRLSLSTVRRRTSTRVRGRLRPPAGAVCRGRVTVTARATARRAVVRRARVSRACRFAVTVRTPAGRRVVVAARFNGTSELLPARKSQVLRSYG
jgi:alpha-L-fucosidase